jgi:hypothetical protein
MFTIRNEAATTGEILKEQFLNPHTVDIHIQQYYATADSNCLGYAIYRPDSRC